MYIGRVQLGNNVVIAILTKTGGVPAVPDNVPTVRIYAASTGTLVYTAKMPVADRYGATGMFLLPIFLNAAFSVGQYYATVGYQIQGTQVLEPYNFEIVPGGDVRGSVISMTWYDRPQAKFVVMETDSGRLEYGRNPRL
jgi:hypothetical protein